MQVIFIRLARFIFALNLLLVQAAYAETETQVFVNASKALKINASLTKKIYTPETLPLSHAACVEKKKADVDLRNEFGPLRSQGQVGWCYAYAGADILGHWLYKTGYTKDPTNPSGMVSATDFALQHIYSNQSESPRRGRLSLKWQNLGEHIEAYEKEMLELKKNKKPLPNGESSTVEENVNDEAMRFLGLTDGGYAEESFISGTNGGICFERDLPSQQTYTGYQKSAGAILQKSLRSYYSNSQWIGSRILCAWDLAKAFPKLDFFDIEAALRTTEEKNPVLFLAETSCKRMLLDKGKPKPKELRNGTSQLPLLFEVDRLLDKGTPVVMAFSAAIFEHDGEKLNKELKDNWHASAIVGKTFDCKTGNWNYLIRNSWGDQGCKNDQEKFLKNNKKKPPYICDKGHYLVPAPLLARAIDSITWLE